MNYENDFMQISIDFEFWTNWATLSNRVLSKDFLLRDSVEIPVYIRIQFSTLEIFQLSTSNSNDICYFLDINCPVRL